MKSYLKKNFQFWDRKYFAPSVEGFVFRLKTLSVRQLYKV